METFITVFFAVWLLLMPAALVVAWWWSRRPELRNRLVFDEGVWAWAINWPVWLLWQIARPPLEWICKKIAAGFSAAESRMDAYWDKRGK